MISENHCFAYLRNRLPTIGKKPISEKRCVRDLKNRSDTNGNSMLFENHCFAYLRNRLPANGNLKMTQLMKLAIFAISEIALPPMEIHDF